MKQYHKLVRDQIPEIIKADGKICICETLSDKDYIYLLDQKLNEELAEYQESKSLEELADLLEVMQAVAKARGWTLAGRIGAGAGGQGCQTGRIREEDPAEGSKGGLLNGYCKSKRAIICFG